MGEKESLALGAARKINEAAARANSCRPEPRKIQMLHRLLFAANDCQEKYVWTHSSRVLQLELSIRLCVLCAGNFRRPSERYILYYSAVLNLARDYFLLPSRIHHVILSRDCILYFAIGGWCNSFKP